MKNQTLVSIIVPVYNVANYVQKCINSIQQQTYQNIEIIIIDDGSTDKTGKICEKIATHDERIKVIRQNNLGVVAARGKGVDISSGKYISFIDGDDWIEKNTIELLVENIKEVDLVSVGVYEQVTFNKEVKRHDKFQEGIYSGRSQMFDFLNKAIFDKNTGDVQSFTPWSVNKLYLCDLTKKVYREVNTEITFAEDSVFLYKYLLKCHSIAICHQCLYHYRYRKESAMHSVNNHILMDINRVYLALKDDFEKHELRESLLFQLQQWVLRMSCLALNYHMGFDERIYISEFIADISNLEDKRIILYGAGKMGQVTYRQLVTFGYSVTLWVDKAYGYYQEKGMDVKSPKEIIDKEFDIVLIAVNDENTVKKIKQDLLQMGISGELLLWKKPMRIF